MKETDMVVREMISKNKDMSARQPTFPSLAPALPFAHPSLPTTKIPCFKTVVSVLSLCYCGDHLGYVYESRLEERQHPIVLSLAFTVCYAWHRM